MGKGTRAHFLVTKHLCLIDCSQGNKILARFIL